MSLGRDDPPAPGLKGEGHQTGALAPLAGGRHDPEHGEQHHERQPDDPDEGFVVQCLRRRGEQGRDDREPRGRRHDDAHPQARPRVDDLAELDVHESMEGHRSIGSATS